MAHLTDVDGVNRLLRHAGHEALPKVTPYLSFSVPLTVYRFMFLPQLRLQNVGASDANSRLESFLATLSFGYSLTPPEYLALYPFAGIGVGTATLSVGQPGPADATFRDALTGTGGTVDPSTVSLLSTVGAAAELLVARVEDHPTRGLFVALRTGFTVVLLSSNWSPDPERRDIEDGPLTPMSGLYGELAFGLRL